MRQVGIRFERRFYVIIFTYLNWRGILSLAMSAGDRPSRSVGMLGGDDVHSGDAVLPLSRKHGIRRH